LRHEIDRLAAAIEYIEAHPHRELSAMAERSRIERVRRPSATLIRSVRRGKGFGNWVTIPGIGAAKARVDARRAAATLDTAEHRWLRQNLNVLRQQLARTIRETTDEAARRAEKGRMSLRLEQERRELVTLLSRISVLTEGTAIAAGSGEAPFGFSSLTLMGLPGYREAFMSLLSLREGLTLQGDALQTSVKDLDRLYEIWCFLRLAGLLTELSLTEDLASDLFKVSERGLRVDLVRGKKSTITLKKTNQTLRLLYNPTYPGPTGYQQPDIVLQILAPGWPEVFVVLDAKYRVDASLEYRRAFGGPGPPVDAVNALHRYRDAITLFREEQGLGRPVVKGVALFPLSDEAASDFQTHKLWKALATLGIGAIPFIPSQTQLLSEWLSALLSSSMEELSSPGPPFLAFEYMKGHSSSTRLS
jgi:hypothetical protein